MLKFSLAVLALWTSHGTRIMGVLVAVLGALHVFDDQIMELWFTPRGDQIFKLCVDITDYMIMGAGAVIIRRGYTNARREGEGPVVPGDPQP